MMQVLHCFCLFVACLVVVDGASLRRGDVRGPSGVPAMRPPPHMLVDAIFGKGNGNTMVDKLQMAGPKAPVSTMQQKADTFLFGTVRKWRKEEGEKAKEKEKELKLHPPMNKGLKQFYNAVAKQRSHTGPDFSGFEKRIEDERAGREDSEGLLLPSQYAFPATADLLPLTALSVHARPWHTGNNGGSKRLLRNPPELRLIWGVWRVPM